MKCADVALGLTPNIATNVFFAIQPDVASRIAIDTRAREFKRAHALRGTSILPDHLHATLHTVADPSESAIETACAAAGRIRLSAFEVSFDISCSFRHQTRPPFVLESSVTLHHLSRLHGALAREMNRAGLRVRRHFTPHVTLVWADRPLDEEYPMIPISWMVREFVLIKSYIGQTRHDIMGRWQLEA